MFLNLLISLSLASTVLVKAPEANPHEFFVFAQNTDAEKISNHFLNCTKTGAIHQTLKDAQFHFLNSSLEKARLLFKEITDNKWSCDWKETERKIITFAFYRLAQMSQNQMEQIQYLTDAINFDGDAAPNDAIFPPPTVSLYNDLKKQLKKKSFTLPAYAKNYSYVLRNGQFINLSSPVLEVYGLRARYTFVSDAFRLETLTVTAEELSESEISPLPWVQGDCKSPQVAGEIRELSQDVKIFFSSTCITESGNQEAALRPASMDALRAPGLPANFVVNEKKSWLQRNYIWVGAAVIGSVIIANQIHQQNKSQTVVVPTSTLTPPP